MNWAFQTLNDNLKELQEKVDLHEAFVMGKLVGYESTVSEHEQRVLERLGISKEMFKIKSLPELSSKGTLRPAFIALKNFKARKVKTGVALRAVLVESEKFIGFVPLKIQRKGIFFVLAFSNTTPK